MDQSIIMLLTLIPLCIVAMFIILKNEGDLLEKMRHERMAKIKNENSTY